MNKGRALGLGITSGLVIISGILIGVLIYVLKTTIGEGYDEETAESKYSAIQALSGPYWTVSIVYVFPGILNFIAALVQNKCFYIICCIVSMIAIAFMGLVIYLAGYPIIIALFGLYEYADTCEDIDGFCKCILHDELTSLGYEATPFKECAYLDRALGLVMASTALVAVAWVFLVACLIILIVFACRSKQTSGTVYTPAQQPMLAR